METGSGTVGKHPTVLIKTALVARQTAGGRRVPTMKHLSIYELIISLPLCGDVFGLANSSRTQKMRM